MPLARETVCLKYVCTASIKMLSVLYRTTFEMSVSKSIAMSQKAITIQAGESALWVQRWSHTMDIMRMNKATDRQMGWCWLGANRQRNWDTQRGQVPYFYSSFSRRWYGSQTLMLNSSHFGRKIKDTRRRKMTSAHFKSLLSFSIFFSI